MYHVEGQSVAGWTLHSEHESFREAVDQADMVRGRVAGEEKAHAWATANQGFTGDFAEWTSQDDEERAEYESGAAGLPTQPPLETS